MHYQITNSLYNLFNSFIGYYNYYLSVVLLIRYSIFRIVYFIPDSISLRVIIFISYFVSNYSILIFMILYSTVSPRFHYFIKYYYHRAILYFIIILKQANLFITCYVNSNLDLFVKEEYFIIADLLN